MKDKAETPCEKVINYIFELIETQEVKIGGRLPSEIQLTKSLNVSRTSVREALQTLKGIGLLESSRGSGYTVKCNIREGLSNVFRAIMAVKEVKHTDISEIREALETKAAELAIKRGIKSEDISELNSFVMKMEMAAQENPVNAINYILISWESVTKNEMRELLITHKKIIFSLEKGDSEQAIKEIINHYRIADQIINSKDSFENSSKSIMDKLLSDGFSAEQIYTQLYDSLSRQKRSI